MKKSALTENNRRVLVIKEKEQRRHFFEYIDQRNRRYKESFSEIREIVDIFARLFSRERLERKDRTALRRQRRRLARVSKKESRETTAIVRSLPLFFSLSLCTGPPRAALRVSLESSQTT